MFHFHCFAYYNVCLLAFAFAPDTLVSSSRSFLMPERKAHGTLPPQVYFVEIKLCITGSLQCILPRPDVETLLSSPDLAADSTGWKTADTVSEPAFMMVSSDLFFPNTLYFKSILRLMIAGSSCVKKEQKKYRVNKPSKID